MRCYLFNMGVEFDKECLKDDETKVDTIEALQREAKEFVAEINERIKSKEKLFNFFKENRTRIEEKNYDNLEEVLEFFDKTKCVINTKNCKGNLYFLCYLNKDNPSLKLLSVNNFKFIEGESK